MIKDAQTLIKDLFSAGAHFGFSKSRRHPSIAKYIFATKQGTDIFDLERTGALLTDAATYMRELGESGKTVLFVSTKEEVSDLVRAQADGTNMPYVTNRWIGGILTNFSEIKKRILRMTTLREQQASGELERKYTKKERLMISRELDKLGFNFGGIVALERAPDAMLVVDPRHDAVAVREARDARVKVIALMSSDCDLSMVDVPVIVNDAQRESVAFALGELVRAYLDGRTRFAPKAPTKTGKAGSSDQSQTDIGKVAVRKEKPAVVR